MAWCEAQQPKLYYCLGVARNSRLRDLLEEKFCSGTRIGHFVWRGASPIERNACCQMIYVHWRRSSMLS